MFLISIKTRIIAHTIPLQFKFSHPHNDHMVFVLCYDVYSQPVVNVCLHSSTHEFSEECGMQQPTCLLMSFTNIYIHCDMIVIIDPLYLFANKFFLLLIIQLVLFIYTTNLVLVHGQDEYRLKKRLLHQFLLILGTENFQL